MPCERDAVSKASLILVSSFFATISAALPFGERIYGTWPGNGVNECKSRSSQLLTHCRDRAEETIRYALDFLFDLLFGRCRRVKDRIRGWWDG